MLSRWDPFQEMLSLRNTVDRLFETTLNDLNSTTRPLALGLALDVIERPEAFEVKASVPGVKPEDLEITFTDNVLTIKGEIKTEEEVKDTRYHLRERRYGTFARSLSLGAHVKGEAIEARYDNGVLTLTLPKSEEVKPKRIQIQGAAKMIDAKSKNSK
jgi:HSP20 family protein